MGMQWTTCAYQCGKSGLIELAVYREEEKHMTQRNPKSVYMADYQSETDGKLIAMVAMPGHWS